MGDLASGYRAKNDVTEMGKHGFDSDTHLRLSYSWVLHIISRSMFLAMVMLLLLSLGSVMRSSFNDDSREGDSDNVETRLDEFKILLKDLVDEGLIKKDHKGLVLEADVGPIKNNVYSFTDDDFDLVVAKKMDSNQEFDFIFLQNFNELKLIDQTLKDGGLVILRLVNDLLEDIRFLRNYKIVYLRRSANIIVAMKKMIPCLHENVEEKKAALKGLEDAYLEPPPQFTSRKIKFLPDLLKDTLKEYPRRVFISDDSKAIEWFYKIYPMKDQEFEVYDMEIGYKKSVVTQENGISSWITNNVKNKDYVVMKAEAGIVEEMLKDKSISLVDELFLECKNQWENGKNKNESKRAYWQCLSLYGKVRDEGIAVHQWWN